MDVAKGMNFLLTNGGKLEDYKGTGRATRPMLPLIAIPTTAGTGSEAQSYCVIGDAKTHMKMACGDKKCSARIAILDPELSVTMPTSVTAVTGIDAISHAVESYVTRKRNPVSMLLARRAWNLLCRPSPSYCVSRRTCRLAGRCCWALIWREPRLRTRCWGRPCSGESTVGPLRTDPRSRHRHHAAACRAV